MLTQTKVSLRRKTDVGGCKEEGKVLAISGKQEHITGGKYFAVPGPLVSPAIAVCGWYKSTYDLNPTPGGVTQF